MKRSQAEKLEEIDSRKLAGSEDKVEVMKAVSNSPNTRSTGTILSLLGHDKRLQILRLLFQSEAGKGVMLISRELAVTAPTAERHLSILKELGLVKKQKTFELSRERWVVRGKKRTAEILKTVDQHLQTLIEAGTMLEELENLVMVLQHYKEHGSYVRERSDYSGQLERLDYLLKELQLGMAEYLDEEEQKKVGYWSSARTMGLL